MKKRNIILAITVLLAVATASAQTVTNVTEEQVGKTIHVSYDLDKQADITLFVSTDGGSTYIQLYRASGDVGKNIPVTTITTVILEFPWKSGAISTTGLRRCMVQPLRQRIRAMYKGFVLTAGICRAMQSGRS